VCVCVCARERAREGGGEIDAGLLLPTIRSIVLPQLIYPFINPTLVGSRWRSGWSTMLQAGRSRVRYPIR
jgi:hypothetical protein